MWTSIKLCVPQFCLWKSTQQSLEPSRRTHKKLYMVIWIYLNIWAIGFFHVPISMYCISLSKKEGRGMGGGGGEGGRYYISLSEKKGGREGSGAGLHFYCGFFWKILKTGPRLEFMLLHLVWNFPPYAVWNYTRAKKALISFPSMHQILCLWEILWRSI